MDLKDFVKESLLQIVEGVTEAQSLLIEKRCIVNPAGDYSIEGIPSMKRSRGISNTSFVITPVSFKVHYQVVEDSKISTGIGGSILSVLTSKIDGSTGVNSVEVQEISFSVPVILPPKSLDS